MDENFAQIGFLLTVITVVILLLVLLLVNLMLTSRNRRLKHRAEMMEVESKLREELAGIRIEVAEATLDDVSRDLHDEVGQLLTFSVLQLENLAASPMDAQQPMLDEIKKSVRDALDSIRSISRGLNPDIVNQQGLHVSLELLIDRAITRTGKHIRMNTQPGFNIRNSSHAIIVFRIIRECLTNAVRHGKASTINISLKNSNETAEISIHDNGVGIKSDSNVDGFGFKTMQHYARLMKGELKTESGNGEGTKILLTFPN